MKDFWLNVDRWLSGRGTSGSPSEAGVRGLEASVQATWDLPPWLILATLLVCGGLLLAIYLREGASAARRWKVLLAAIRLALVAIVLLMLYGWTIQEHRTDLPDVVVMLDDSASMGLVDQYDDSRLAAEIERRLAGISAAEATRLDLARALLLAEDQNLLSKLAARYNLRLFTAGSTARLVDSGTESPAIAIGELAADEPASRLGDAVIEVLESQRGRPTAAVIVLTDGVTTSGSSLSAAAQVARRKTIPLFLVGLGSDQPVRDLSVSDLLVDEAVFVGDLVQFDFKFTAEGYTGQATVRLLVAGQSEPLAEQQVEIDPESPTQTIRLVHRPEEQGELEFVIEVVPREGELNVENNRLTRKVRVREELIRVLLVQAYPNYEFRFLKQMLARELNRDQPTDGKTQGFRTVLQEADPEYVETDKTAERLFPVSREELFSYDVLIFGDVNPTLLSPSILENVAEFVTVRGGGVIFIAGPRYTPLAYRGTPLEALLPIDLDTVRLPDPDAPLTAGFRPRLTPLGLASPMMQLADTPAENRKLWEQRLEPLRWFARTPDVRPGVRVLAEHPTELGDDGQPLPIISLQFNGAGKVLFHATDETYRWRYRVGDTYFARYWIQSIRYLCRAKLLSAGRTAELATDRDEYRRGEAVELRVRFLDDSLAPQADDGVLVVLQREGGERRNVTLRRGSEGRGVFAGSAGNLPDGKYRAWLAAPTVEGQPPFKEFVVSAPPGELARTRMDAAELAAAAKASQGKFYRFAEAENLLDDLPRGRQVRIESLPPRPLWNTPLLAGLFVLLIGVEWLLRKRVGLL
jgi:hypothetical protein